MPKNNNLFYKLLKHKKHQPMIKLQIIHTTYHMLLTFKKFISLQVPIICLPKLLHTDQIKFKDGKFTYECYYDFFNNNYYFIIYNLTIKINHEL